MGAQLQDWRCATCNRLLARIHLAAGSVAQVKCDRCATLNVLQAAAAEMREPFLGMRAVS